MAVVNQSPLGIHPVEALLRDAVVSPGKNSSSS